MLEEDYIKGTGLILREDWEKHITGIRAKTKEDLIDKSAAIRHISSALQDAIKARVPEGKKFGVLFSGGIDSSLIAFILKKKGLDFNCYTIGFKDENTKEPEDVEAAVRAAKEIGAPLKTLMLGFDKAETLIKKTVKILGYELNNVVNAGVGGVVVGCAELARKDGVDFLYSGLGSEEIFAGYDRHKKSGDAQEECWKGLIGMYERDLLRDSAISTGMKIKLMTPFLDEKLIASAMRIPVSMKINDETSKLILREAAEEMGLPKDITWRKKRAAQYGSRLDRAIDKLARKKGFTFKKDYLKSLERSA